MALRTPRTFVSFFPAMCALGALSLGCGGDDEVGKLYPVSGRILVDGKPLTGVGQGSVSFHGDGAKGNQTMHIPTGAIDPEGKFELVTVGRKGAPPGWYKVLVSASANKPEEGPVMPRRLLDDKYYDVQKTDLSIEVVAKPSPGAYDLNVKGVTRKR
jgi:hypothetical protein